MSLDGTGPVWAEQPQKFVTDKSLRLFKLAKGLACIGGWRLASSGLQWGHPLTSALFLIFLFVFSLIF